MAESSISDLVTLEVKVIAQGHMFRRSYEVQTLPENTTYVSQQYTIYFLCTHSSKYERSSVLIGQGHRSRSLNFLKWLHRKACRIKLMYLKESLTIKTHTKSLKPCQYVLWLRRYPRRRSFL